MLFLLVPLSQRQPCQFHFPGISNYQQQRINTPVYPLNESIIDMIFLGDFKPSGRHICNGKTKFIRNQGIWTTSQSYGKAKVDSLIHLHGVDLWRTPCRSTSSIHNKNTKTTEILGFQLTVTLYSERRGVSLISCVQYLSGSLRFMLTVLYVSIVAYLVDGAS